MHVRPPLLYNNGQWGPFACKARRYAPSANHTALQGGKISAKAAQPREGGTTNGRQQAQLAQEQQELHRRKGLLDNGDPNFKNGKEKIYDRLPVTAKQMDLVVKVLEAAIVVVLAVALLDKYLF